MVTDSNTMIEIDKKDISDANFFACKFANKKVKDRAFVNALGAKLAIKYFESEGLNVENIYNLHYVRKILEEFDIADVMFPNIHIDVRVVYDDNQIFIPKSHFDFNITPDIYVVMKVNNDFSKMELLGFVEPGMINKNNCNDDYYFLEKEKLSNISDLKTYIENFKGDTMQSVDDEDVEKIRNMMFDTLDNDIEKEDKKTLFQYLLKSGTLRDSFIELENFETLSYSALNNPNIKEPQIDENTVDISALTINDDGTFKSGLEDDVEALVALPEDDVEESSNETSQDNQNENSPEPQNEVQDNEEEHPSDEDSKGNVVDAISEVAGNIVEGAATAGLAATAAMGAEAAIADTTSSVASAATGSVAQAAINEADNILNSMDDFLADVSNTPTEVENKPETTDEENATLNDNKSELNSQTENDISVSDKQEESAMTLDTDADGNIEALDLDNISDETLGIDDNDIKLDLDENISLNETSTTPEDIQEVPTPTEDDLNLQDENKTTISDITSTEDDINVDSTPNTEDDNVSQENAEKADLFTGEFEDAAAPSATTEDEVVNLEDFDFGDNDGPELDVDSDDTLDFGDADAVQTSDENSINVEDLEIPENADNQNDDMFSFEELDTEDDKSGFGKDLLNSLSEKEEKDVDIEPLSSTDDSESSENIDNMSSDDDMLDEIDQLLSSTDEMTPAEPEISDEQTQNALDDLQDEVPQEENSEDNVIDVEAEQNESVSDVPSDNSQNDDDSFGFISDESIPTIETSPTEATAATMATAVTAETSENIEMLFNEDLTDATDDTASSIPQEPSNEQMEQESQMSEMTPGMNLHSDSGKSMKKATIIAVASLVSVLAVAGIGYGIKTKSQKAPEPSVPAPISNVPVTPPQGNNAMNQNLPDVSQAQRPVEPQRIATPAPQHVSRPKMQVTSSGQPYLSVKNVVWQVPGYLSSNGQMRSYLKSAGKSIKLSLSSDLLLATDYAYSNRVKLNLKVSSSGAIENTTVVASSGSTQIDNIVLQSVKNTLNVVKPPTSAIKTPDFNLTITIYL
ncbi:MAG: DUF1822 family protein [Clostridiaceae bacterium]|jgi:hypothetical protein|nr:DUF1822 family protein [Clostridiaceae bacterium]